MDKKWPVHISARAGRLNLHIRELFGCGDMIWLFVKRNITTTYKQTVLGPVWLIISPLLSSAVHNIVFSDIANLSTDGVPSYLFYFCGNLIWSLFSGILISNSNIFLANQSLFGKVYFPRLSVPVASVITKFFYFLIQLLLLGGFTVYFACSSGAVNPSLYLLLLPVLMLHTALLGLGIGLILSALTAKYRDLSSLVSFGTGLLMYATPVVYPSSAVDGLLRDLIMLNPMSPIVETFRYAFFGCGSIPWENLGISLAATAAILFLGILMFNRVERTFVDTV